MSAIREDQKENASKFMNVFWTQLVKPYYNPENTDKWWEEVFGTLSKIGDTYCKNDKILKAILFGFETGLEEVYRNERGRQT